MRRTTRSLLIVPFLLGLYSCFWGNDNDPIDPEDPGREITITIRNSDAQPVHLFVKTESFPCCQVLQGSSRQFTETLTVGSRFEVRAGRNGTLLNSTNCSITQANFDSRSKTVTFLGNGWSCGS